MKEKQRNIKDPKKALKVDVREQRVSEGAVCTANGPRRS